MEGESSPISGPLFFMTGSGYNKKMKRDLPHRSKLPGRVLRLDPAAGASAGLEATARVLRRGGVIVYPTETYYGLGGSGLSGEAAARVFRIKGREAGKALSLVAADMSAVEAVAAGIPGILPALAEAFWPGPLTVVLRAAPGLPGELTGGGGTVAVRVPGHDWLRALLREAGLPLIATSANLSGEPPLVEGVEAAERFRDRVDLVVDAGRCPGGLPSTVLDLTRSPPRILRPGAVPAQRLAPYLI